MRKIKKKKILLLIHHNQIYNIIEISRRLENKFKLIFFITDLYSSYDISRQSYNLIKTYFPASEIYDYYYELKNLNNDQKVNKIDFKFLKKFEDKLYSKSLISNLLKDVESDVRMTAVQSLAKFIKFVSPEKLALIIPQL